MPNKNKQAKACTLFARAQGVSRQQVNEWLVKEFIVVDWQLYSPRREMKT